MEWSGAVHPPSKESSDTVLVCGISWHGYLAHRMLFSCSDFATRDAQIGRLAVSPKAAGVTPDSFHPTVRSGPPAFICCDVLVADAEVSNKCQPYTHRRVRAPLRWNSVGPRRTPTFAPHAPYIVASVYQ
jgi:hypothetical protein